MAVPIIYNINQWGVITHPTIAWQFETFDITVGSPDGYFWASGSHGKMSDRGWGSPVSCTSYWNLHTSREQAILQEANFVYRQLQRDLNDCTKKDAPKIKVAIKSLLDKFPELFSLSPKISLAVMVTII